MVLRVKEINSLFFSVCELWISAQEKKLNMMGDSSELFYPYIRVTASNDQRWKHR